jgi:hypothetical protein
MTNTALKAGAIGGAAAIVVALIGLIPCVGCIGPILGILVYLGAGALAAYWLPVPREMGSAAGAGAIAAVIAGLIGGIFGMIISALRFAISGGAQAMSQLPPETMQQLGNLGIDPGTIAAMTTSIVGVLGVGAVCCLIGLVIAAILGAIGGVVFAAVKKD